MTASLVLIVMSATLRGQLSVTWVDAVCLAAMESSPDPYRRPLPAADSEPYWHLCPVVGGCITLKPGDLHT